MKLITKYMTKNDCFLEKRAIVPMGITIHSTAEPGMRAQVWYELWNKPAREQNGRDVCVHAFVDDETAVQYLPWNHRGWHAGGRDNNDHIGIELCEPAGMKYASDFELADYDPGAFQPYFNRLWQNAVELCVMLMRRYPTIRVEEIVSHDEGFRRGTASAHHDPEHWWVHHGKTMDDFRNAVRDAMEAEQ